MPGNFVRVDTASIKKFADALGRAADQFPARLHTVVKTAGDAVVRTATTKAAEFSPGKHGKGKVPDSIRLAETEDSVVITAGGPGIPEARLYEYGGKGTPYKWRHPLFGQTGSGQWFNQKTHPFLRPAMAEGEKVLETEARSAVNEIVEQVAVESD